MPRKKSGKKTRPSKHHLLVTVVEERSLCAVQHEYLDLILDLGAERERIFSEARAEAEMIIRNARDAARVTMARAARRTEQPSAVA